MLQQLAPKYIATGKVKVIYKNFPVIGPESITAAQAALCASDQNKFWEYGNYLFAHQQSENSGAFTADHLKQFAADLGLNQSEFNSCLDSGKYANAVNHDYAEGQQRGVQATPTFFINGTKYEGALPADQLSTIIDAQLNK